MRCNLPLLSVVAILLVRLAMGILLGGADDAYEMDEIVLAVSAAIEGDRIDETEGDVTD